MTTLELELYQSVPSVEFNTYWIPCTWFINLLKEARKSHRLPDAQGLKIIMEVRLKLMLFSFPFIFLQKFEDKIFVVSILSYEKKLFLYQ